MRTHSRITAVFALSALLGWGCSDSAQTGDTSATGTSSGGAGTSTGASPTSGSSTGGVGGKAPSVPTVSSWMGTNVAADMARVDITYQLNPFDTPANQKDANGYPVAGAAGTSSTDIGFVLPSGTYKISYKGGAKLDVSGVGKLTGDWSTASGEQRNELVITGTPGAFGNFLTLSITATPGQTATEIHILSPGFDYDTTTVFLPSFLKLLTPFKALRFMEWENINGSTLADWADRPTSSSFGASPNGQPYEHIVELVNETGKDCWVNIPEHASDDFIHQFAAFLAKNLDQKRIAKARKEQGFTTPFRLIVENSNETWNQSFTAYATFLSAANAQSSRYTGVYDGTYGPSWMSGSSDLMKVGQYEADRLVKIGTIFKTELGDDASEVSPVLAGWALGAVYSDVGMRFIKANYGDPKDYVAYVAMAPYFAADDAQTGSLEALFTDTDKSIAAFDTTFQDFKKLGSDAGVEIAAYEGGQSFNGTTNQQIKHLAQHDQRMYAAYQQYLALWKQDFGESLFMHFDLAGTPGTPENIFQYGYWGSIISALEDPAQCSPDLPTLTGTEDVATVIHHCPKYRALMETLP